MNRGRLIVRIGRVVMLFSVYEVDGVTVKLCACQIMCLTVEIVKCVS